MSDELVSSVAAEYDRLRRDLYARGFGQRLGFGAKSAVLVIDFIRGFTDTRSAIAANFDAEVAAARRVLDVARGNDVPVILSTAEYDPDLVEAGVFGRKTAAANMCLIRGSEWVDFDERLGQDPRDGVLVKKYASCFSGTDLVSRLVSRGVDTLVITGCTTSGCVRATAVDACSLGFRPIVVEEAVGDRAPISHLASLFDLDFKYADVVTVDEAIEALSVNVLQNS
jgi:nicotinamidase-related amidase